jgi:hypothetical protein
MNTSDDQRINSFCPPSFFLSPKKIGRPSSRRQVTFGAGTPSPRQVSVKLNPSRTVMCEAELPASTMVGGTKEKTFFEMRKILFRPEENQKKNY